MEHTRAYSLMTVKAVNEDEQVITGIASTPSPDRYGDVMEPDGAKFNLPLPLLWQHDPLQPIGSITKARVTNDGIEITAQVAKADAKTPSLMAARLAEAWASIKSGLVRGLSIGFRPIEYAYIDDGGTRFTAWDLMEVSAVTIPANADCNIQTIKNFSGKRAALGTDAPKTLAPSGVSLKSKGKNTVNIAEQIKSFETKRATLEAEREGIMAKSFEEGRTLDVEETEKYDNVSAEVKSVDAHLMRLRDMEAMQAKSAKPVAPAGLGTVSTVSAPAVIHVEKKLDKGIAFARYAKSLAAARGVRSDAVEYAKQFYPDDAKLTHILKAGVSAGSTTHATWAKPLSDYLEIANDFVEYLRPQTIIGKFGQGGIPGLRSVPFNVRVPTQTSGGSAGWVGEGAAKPLTKFDFGTIEFKHAKIASIAVLTDELVRFSNPSADVLVRNSLADAITEQLDADFILASNAGTSGIKPAAITNGAGIKTIKTAGDPELDIAAAFSAFVTANLTPTNGVWIMGATTALTLSMIRNPLGQKQYPDLTMLGGSLAGLPVIVSKQAEGMLVLVNASDVYLADDGGVQIDASREASLEMVDASTMNSVTPTGGTSMVSMFQTNSVAIRAERWINWQRRRDEGVVVINQVAYQVSHT
ncbi:TPA: phage major capsid protein [Klebsiella variicola subsp. variicola]|nr:phage major capsid protein [Klebsiella variicola subsp. variicola]